MKKILLKSVRICENRANKCNGDRRLRNKKCSIDLHMDCQSDSGRMVQLGNWLESVVLVHRVKFAEQPVQNVRMTIEFGQEFDWMQLVVNRLQLSYDH